MLFTRKAFRHKCCEDVVEAAAGVAGHLDVGVDGHQPRFRWHLLGGGLGPGDGDDGGHRAWEPGGGPMSTCPTSLLLLNGDSG